MFPIFDVAGLPVAFGGRILPGSDEPKYKNSAETPLYAKSRTLYALNFAKANIVQSNEVIVCEGYTDVIGFFRSGLPRAVATCGTALTEEHVRLLKSFATRIVLAYDADSAGQAAAERFYEWERKLGIDIAVLELPRGMDPGEAAQKDPVMLKKAIESAKPFLEFRLQRVLSSSDIRSIEGRARAAHRCVEMVAEHPDAGVRHQYLQLIEGWTKVPFADLQTMAGTVSSVQRGSVWAPAVIDLRSSRPVPDMRNGKASNAVNAANSAASSGMQRVELEALRVVVHQPEDVLKVLELIVPPNAPAGIEEVLFLDTRMRAAFRALTEAPTLVVALDQAEPEAAEILARLAVEEEEGNAQDSLLRLVDRAASRAVRELEAEARVSIDAGTSVGWLKLSIEHLRTPATAMEAAPALVGWLLDRAQDQDSIPDSDSDSDLNSGSETPVGARNDALE